ncbi:hypothetical protein PILCRDRAFT_824925 [Piloderma croceum F 1598]|uniref:Uncharacterized protein n=1 Tax=Piloderma croceum (strain F 1598) TaxID=765440 RepID=A0A0C3BKS4_PILCF|nr:hypothetical protein PILCRDRAFT_824925 [Piloderma croceum F 1598]
MRMSIIATIVIEVLLPACLTAVFIANHSATSPDNKEKMRAQFPAKSEDFSAWISVILLAFPPALIIPLSLRLDFANYMVSATPLHLMTLEEVPADKIATNPTLKLSRGIVIPRTIPFTLKYPYFASTLLAWLLANVVITYVLVYGWLSDPDRFTYLLSVFVVAIPMVIMSVFGVSLLRGEVERTRNDGVWRLL